MVWMGESQVVVDATVMLAARAAGSYDDILWIQKRFSYLLISGFQGSHPIRFSYLWIEKVFVSFGSKWFFRYSSCVEYRVHHQQSKSAA